ncbi:hypothetical protein OQJ46_11415 [Microbulbifer thermotolerans]|uniref:hypothetical protein n=1 Tax=Microbulbifer thermotolerans TaxID=252514 RepID=UPI00224AB738|nr:hypothetical protein [Microbulbifer thermotolerans]MCX2783594.1 hypothetical protein [Microbulbifer thermotolerans]MCX2842051.1 hypothetical protein [Microbulbifer thermotolerans]
MELERLAIRARLRSPWESIDLGIALARQHWWPLFIVWLLPASVVFACSFWLLHDSPSWALLLVWWLKPVYDRLPLFIASRALFGERVSVSGALKQFFSLNRRDWFAWLTWRRLSATRSYDMPVTLLEQTSGSARAARIGVLHRKHSNAATWLTLTGFHLEFFLFLALLAFMYLLIPEQVQIDWLPMLTNSALWLEWASNVLYLLVMAAVAPFYVVSGFCLYIGRRIELEAWDIEIQFRSLRDRHLRAQKDRQKRAAHATTAASLLLLCVLSISTLLPAEDASAEAALTPEQSRETIDQVLAGEDFHQQEEVSGWRLKELDMDSEIPEWLIDFVQWLENRQLASDKEREVDWAAHIGLLAELLLWAAFIGLVAYLLLRHREQILQSLRWQRKKPETRLRPETLFGLDVRQSSLPDDVCAEVLRLWRSGDKRGGLGLLYRATLAHLIESYQFEFGDHLTESECAQLVRQRQARPQPEAQRPVSAALCELVQQLTVAWQQLAYAHRAPQLAQVETLCNQWQEAFGNED